MASSKINIFMLKILIPGRKSEKNDGECFINLDLINSQKVIKFIY